MSCEALRLLGIYIKVERNTEGAWSIKVEKNPTDAVLLRVLMEKLLGLTPKNPTP